MDDMLPVRDASAVREHLETCRGCRRHLRELEAAERLLRRVPASLIPLEASPAAETRLRGLARWLPEPEPGGGWRLPALGGTAAALALVVTLWVLPHSSGLLEPEEGAVRAVVATRMPSSFLVPTFEPTGSVPYTWRQ